MTTAALLRVSTAGQSVASQRSEIERWAAARGRPIGKWYGEREAVSGASEARDDLESMLEDARRGRVSCVVVAELSRLSRRGLAHVAGIMDELRACNVALVSLREGLDSSTPLGRAMMGMASIFAELERDRLRDRVKAGIELTRDPETGKLTKTKSGLAVGRPGWIWTDTALAELRALLADGWSLSAIAREEMLALFRRQRGDDGEIEERAGTPSPRAMARALKRS